MLLLNNYCTCSLPLVAGYLDVVPLPAAGPAASPAAAPHLLLVLLHPLLRLNHLLLHVQVVVHLNNKNYTGPAFLQMIID